MQLIRCTKKLQKEMGLKKKDLLLDEPLGSSLGPWHANLLYIDRKKCILFVNDKTLFNYIVPNVQRSQIRELASLFRTTFATVLSSENISGGIIDKVTQNYEFIGYTSRTNRSILGSMNDLTINYKYHILSEGGVHSPLVPSIINQLNRMPMGPLGLKYSIDFLHEELKNLP